MLLYFTAVTSHFPLNHLTNETFDVQWITCLLDLTLSCELKENIFIACFEYGE
jgi:hypothetical protein